LAVMGMGILTTRPHPETVVKMTSGLKSIPIGFGILLESLNFAKI